MGMPRGRVARIALGTAGGIVAVLVIAQLALPGIAARIAREQIGKYGTVRSVSLKAFPAIELLWGHAESARVEAGALRMSVSQFDGLLPRMKGIRNIDMTAESFQMGSIRINRVSTEKRGDELYTRGTLTQADLQSALPAGMHMRLVENADGAVEVRVSGSLFGIGASVLALLSAQEGKLIAQPQGFPFAGLARITIFSDPHLFVQDVGLSAQSGAAADAGYALTLRAELR
jgi:LmeA-like phospholipid-binding